MSDYDTELHYKRAVLERNQPLTKEGYKEVKRLTRKINFENMLDNFVGNLTEYMLSNSNSLPFMNILISEDGAGLEHFKLEEQNKLK